MGLSDVISFFALAVSCFTFYWATLRHKKAFYLIRIDNLATRINPLFALINAGNSEILVTSVLCAFEDADGNGWEAPDGQNIVEGGGVFSILPGTTRHCEIELPSHFSEDFLKTGLFKNQGGLDLYYKDMMIIVEWIDTKGFEHKAEPRIRNYGFTPNGQATLHKPLIKLHNLYKIAK